MPHLALLLYMLLFLTAFQSVSSAQPASSTQESRAKSLEIAREFMNSRQSQRTVVITGPMLKQLEAEGQYDSPFGLQVRLVHGSALIHTDTTETALEFLLKLKTTSKAKKQWEVVAETCRVIASELEYAGRKEESLFNLREAQTTIQQYHLDSIYPHFAVRISSWHRQFGNPDSSVFYANEAIRTAPKFGKLFEEAEGHFLLAMNYGNTDPEKAISQYKTAAGLYRKTGNLTSFSCMYMGMARLNLVKNPSEAMTNIDTAILNYPRINVNNIELLRYMYILKGDIFQQLGQPDSAIFYLKKGYSMQLEYLQAFNREKIIEIDNKYNVAEKNLELDSKNLEIQVEKTIRNLLTATAAMVLLFAGVVVFYYLQLRKANQITREQSEQLKNLDASKSRFFANVSHELRTPLSLMLGPIRSLLKENELSEKQARLLQMANRNGKQLNQLINEILDLRKLEMGKMELNLQPTGLAPFFSKHAAQFESLAQRKQIDFSVETKSAQGITANIDREKCRQILYNLLSNAFKFTPAGGQVKLKIGNWVNRPTPNFSISQFQISVSDTGPGIHPDDLPHVFDRFFQTIRPDKPAEGGTGIGLALCKEYATLFGGTITVDSLPGEGSVFRVTFPVEVVQMPKLIEDVEYAPDEKAVVPLFIKENEKAPPPHDDSRPTILMAEDNPELQDYIRLILSEKYNVVIAANGKAALEWLTADDERQTVPNRQLSTLNRQPSVIPDLILSDLMMPVMDGYQLLEKLKSDDTTRHIPVIMLTARAEASDRLKALRIGVDDYLTKPFDEEELLVRIENLLKNQAARQQKPAAETEPEADIQEVPKDDREWLEAFEIHVLQNLSNDILSIPMLAHAFSMSESTLLRQLKRLTGLTPQKYLQEVRLNEALLMLENRQHVSIAKVASKVGFGDVRSFSRSFKGRFGKSPSEIISD